MRSIQINLWQNTGTRTPGALKVLSGQVKDLADLTEQVDGRNSLTKVTPGNLTCKVLDPDGSIETFLQTQLATAKGLLPPWLELYVGGERKFLGTADPSRIVIKKSAREYAIEVGAVDWSQQLAGVYLGAPTAPPREPSTDYEKDDERLSGSSVYVCTVPGTSSATVGPSGIGEDILDGTVHWSYVAPKWKRAIPSKASNGSTPDPQSGWSYSNVYLTLGRYQNAVFITNPCAGFGRAAVVTMTHPVFVFEPNPTPPYYGDTEGGNRNQYPGATYRDDDGQIWTYQVVGQAHGDDVYGWVITTAWAAPGTYSTALPNTSFPAGTILQTPAGALWQVSANGQAWTQDVDSSYASPYFTVLEAHAQNSVFPATYNNPGATEILLSSKPWPTSCKARGHWAADFTLFGATLADVSYWDTTVDIPEQPTTPCYALPLESVDGINPGDTLNPVNSTFSGSWRVAGVDPTLLVANTVEEITGGVPRGTHIFWDTDSQAELCRQDPKNLLAQAAYPFTVDLSQFSAPTTQTPVFGFLPVPAAVGDVWATLDGLKLSQAGNWGVNKTPCRSWAGTPEAGWILAEETTYQPTAEWTSQVEAVPAYLMPYSLGNPFQRIRNRAYSDVVYRQESNGLIIVNGHWVNGLYVRTVSSGTYEYTEAGTTYRTSTGDNFQPWSPNGATFAGQLTIYDYTTMRQLVVNGAQVQVTHWTSATSSENLGTFVWPSGRLVQSLVPWIGTPGTYLAYTVDGTGNDPRLEMWGLAGGLLNTAVCSISVALQGGTLVSTPYAVYLVGGSAIAEVTFTAGVINPITQYFVDVVSCFFANTLAARTESDFVIMGRYDLNDNGSKTTETRLLRISIHLTATLDGSVFLEEKISEGAPTVAGAVRDPSKPGRVVGHFGGSLWQYDTQVPMSIDRFAPSGMTALELIEHICQQFSAIAVPDADGTLHIISRTLDEPAIELTLDQVSISSTLNWSAFASIVRITSQDSDYYFDAFGQQGGALLEIDEHPLCGSLSACIGMAEGLVPWFGVPRRDIEQKWFFRNANVAPPWEAVRLFTKLKVNGGPSGKLMSRNQNFIKGTATVNLVTV